ncbi:MAG: zinc-binding dehydrogenase [Sedimentisphaerales bacterium]|nr:zinc-binding dehydrogenase [Sedimentisphaerales bacterium]
MKAAVIEQHGGPDRIRIAEMPEPQCGPDEVLLEVRAAALNHLDIWVCKGRRGLELSLPHVLGSDAAGIVITAGERVEHLAAGDEVVLYPGLYCGHCEFCRRGEHGLCESFGILGAGRSGTFAQRVAVPARCAFPKPKHLSFSEAAALGIDHLTAWRMLIGRARLTVGQSVLIHGIGGGAALAGLQIAKLAGAEVIVTSSSPDKLEQARRLGADYGILYRRADVAAKVRQWTQKRGVDVILDSTGAETWAINEQSLRRGGTVVHCGVTTGAEATVNIRNLYWNQIQILGSTMGSQEDFRAMLRAVCLHGLKPVIDSVHPLDHAGQAMKRLEKGEQFGKIVLEIQ